MVAVFVVTLFPFPSFITHLTCQPFHLPTVFVMLAPVADWKFVQPAFALLLYCHWYLRLFPSADTFHVACFPSATVTSAGCAVILIPDIWMVAVFVVTLFPFPSFITHLTCQPFHLPTVFVMLAPVADWKFVQPAFALLLYCHWYLRLFPSADTFHVACFPSATVTSVG